MLSDCLKQTDSGIIHDGNMHDLEFWLEWTEDGNHNLSELNTLQVKRIKTWGGWLWLCGLKAYWTESQRVEALIEKYADQLKEWE